MSGRPIGALLCAFLVSSLMSVCAYDNVTEIEMMFGFSGFRETGPGRYTTRVTDENGAVIGSVEFHKIEEQLNMKLFWNHGRYDLMAGPDNEYLFIAPDDKVAVLVIDAFGAMEIRDDSSRKVVSDNAGALRILHGAAFIFNAQVLPMNGLRSSEPGDPPEAPCQPEDREYCTGTGNSVVSQGVACYGARTDAHQCLGYPSEWYCFGCNCTESCPSLCYWTCTILCFRCTSGGGGS